jgi:hypothetical protein
LSLFYYDKHIFYIGLTGDVPVHGNMSFEPCGVAATVWGHLSKVLTAISVWYSLSLLGSRTIIDYPFWGFYLFQLIWWSDLLQFAIFLLFLKLLRRRLPHNHSRRTLIVVLIFLFRLGLVHHILVHVLASKNDKDTQQDN